MPCATHLEGLLGTILFAQVHQTRHFVFGQDDVLAPKLSELDVGDFVGWFFGGHDEGWFWNR